MDKECKGEHSIGNEYNEHRSIEKGASIKKKEGDSSEGIDAIETNNNVHQQSIHLFQTPSKKLHTKPRPAEELINSTHKVTCLSTPEINEKATKVISELKKKYSPINTRRRNNNSAKSAKANIIKPQYIEYRIINQKKYQILYESSMLKYHPGFNMQFVERYGIVTSSHFIYFNNLWAAHCNAKPILCVPLQEVQSIETVKSLLEPSQVIYEFEIFMKSDKDPATLSIKTPLPQSFINTIDFPNNLQYTPPSQSKLFNEKLTKSQNIYKSKVVQGHLMLSPEKHFLDYSLVEFTNTHQMQKVQKCEYQGIKFDAEEEKEEYIKYVHKHKATLLHRIRSIEVMQSKSLKAYMKNYQGKETWANREIEWFLSESRLHFACNTQDERDKWVFLLNWLKQRLS